jgi:DNA-directed RNA polymerase subunit beta
MTYSYTEKKRIRKNFGTFAKVMDLPNLIETQLNSYSEFLQSDISLDARKETRSRRSFSIFISYN